MYGIGTTNTAVPTCLGDISYLSLRFVTDDTKTPRIFLLFKTRYLIHGVIVDRN